MMRDTTETEFDVNGATYRLVLSTLARQRTQLGPTATGFHITSSFFFRSTQMRCMPGFSVPYCRLIVR